MYILVMKMQIISGSCHRKLAQKVSKYLKIKLTPTQHSSFADGEIYVRIKRKVRGDDIFLIQSICPPVNDSLMELLITIDALRRASAGRINVIIPYLAYSRQDRKVVSREPISAKLIANLITTAGAHRIFTVDLHKDQIQGFYDIPVDHFVGYPLFAKHFKKQKLKHIIVVAPDVGAAHKARKMATLLKSPIAIIDKRRTGHNESEILNLIGDVRGKTAILIDDLVDTGGTITKAADALTKAGARDVKICATHALLSGEAVKKIDSCSASEALFLNTIPRNIKNSSKKIKYLSMAKLLSRAMLSINQEKSLGKLFVWEDKLTKL